jgi:hypothetical protein
MTKNFDIKIVALRFQHIKILYLFILFSVFYLFSFIIKSTNKGIDWTDESFVYELNSHLSFQQNQTWGFQYFGHLFMLLTGGDVLFLRVIRLAMFITINYFLIFLAGKYLLKEKVSLSRLRFVSVLLSFVSLFFTYAYFPRAFGYNELAAWCGSLIAIVLLKLITIQTKQKKSSIYFLVFLLGILNSSLFFIKFTSGLILIGISACLLLCRVHALASLSRGRLISVFIASLILVPALIQMLTGQAFLYFDSLIDILRSPSEQSGHGHSIDLILSQYLSQFKLVAWTLLKLAVLPLSFIILIIRVLANKNNSESTKSLDLIGYLITIVIVFISFPISFEKKWESVGDFTIAIAIVALVFVSRLLLTKQINFEVFSVLLFLTLLPFFLSFGTNNPIGGQTMISNVGLLIVSIFIAVKLLSNDLGPFFVAAFIGVLVISIGPSLIHGSTVGMYRIAPIQELNSKVTKIDSLKNIYITKEEQIQFDWLAETVEQLSINSIFVPLTTPAYNYAISNSGFGSAWMDSWWPISFSNLEISCRSPLDSKSVLVLVAPIDLQDNFVLSFNSALNNCGLEFPENFSVLDQDPTNSIRVWVRNN